MKAKVAGIDIGSREHSVCGPALPNGGSNVRVFRTTTPSLHQLADWLIEQGVEADGATAERCQRGRSVDRVALSRLFLEEFADRYDTLVAVTNFESEYDGFAFAVHISNAVTGIGEPVFDHSSPRVSRGELESFVSMGDMRRYPGSPHDRVTAAASAPTVLGLVGHEVGHRFLARERVSRAGLPRPCSSDASFLPSADPRKRSHSDRHHPQRGTPTPHELSRRSLGRGSDDSGELHQTDVATAGATDSHGVDRLEMVRH